MKEDKIIDIYEVVSSQIKELPEKKPSKENSKEGNDEEEENSYKISHRFLPPLVGELKWLKQIQGQVKENVDNFSKLNHP